MFKITSLARIVLFFEDYFPPPKKKIMSIYVMNQTFLTFLEAPQDVFIQKLVTASQYQPRGVKSRVDFSPLENSTVHTRVQ